MLKIIYNDQPIKAQKVVRLLKSGLPIFVNEVVFPEIEYVLRKVYKAPRGKIIASYKLIASVSSVKISKVVRRAITMYEKTSLDMADCIIATERLKGKLASFDERLLKTPGVKKYW